MATTAELLVDGFGRIRENVADVLSGLTTEQLAYQIDSGANPVAWLVWHLGRVRRVRAARGVPRGHLRAVGGARVRGQRRRPRPGSRHAVDAAGNARGA